MIGNADKSKLILNNTNKENHITILNERIYNSDSAKILGITFDNNLNFDIHVHSVQRGPAPSNFQGGANEKSPQLNFKNVAPTFMKRKLKKNCAWEFLKKIKVI